MAYAKNDKPSDYRRRRKKSAEKIQEVDMVQVHESHKRIQTRQPTR